MSIIFKICLDYAIEFEIGTLKKYKFPEHTFHGMFFYCAEKS